jgi:hypothetical protein
MKRIQEKGMLYRAAVSSGDVFIKNFVNIDHPKYFVVAGMSEDKIYVCAVYINSNIPGFMYSRQKLLNLQVHIKGKKYAF